MSLFLLPAKVLVVARQEHTLGREIVVDHVGRVPAARVDVHAGVTA
jgi:hypothetical protein